MIESVPTGLIALLRISLEGIEPAIWRQFEVPLAGALKALHDVIQAAFGCEGRRLHHFEVGEERYGVLIEWDGRRLVRSWKSRRLAVPHRPGTKRFDQTCDFGNSCCGKISVEAA